MTEIEEEAPEVPMLMMDMTFSSARGNDTDIEKDEAITPDTSAHHLTAPLSPILPLLKKGDSSSSSEDMEAAIALLDFMDNREHITCQVCTT